MKKYVIIGLIIGVVALVSSGCAAAASKSGNRGAEQPDLISSGLIITDSQYKLVFFGYAGCYHFCDPRLRQIDTIYRAIKPSLDVKMLFVDISEETTPEAAERFAKDVNSEFEAISPEKERLKRLQKEFQDVFVRKMADGEYIHSGFLYLLKKEGQQYSLLKIYPEFDHSEAVSADIRKITGR